MKNLYLLIGCRDSGQAEIINHLKSTSNTRALRIVDFWSMSLFDTCQQSVYTPMISELERYQSNKWTRKNIIWSMSWMELGALTLSRGLPFDEDGYINLQNLLYNLDESISFHYLLLNPGPAWETLRDEKLINGKTGYWSNALIEQQKREDNLILSEMSELFPVKSFIDFDSEDDLLTKFTDYYQSTKAS